MVIGGRALRPAAAMSTLCLVLALAMAEFSAAVVKRRSAQHWEVEYEDYELPENETDGGQGQPPRDWQDSDDQDVYGFDIEPCIARGCTEQMLNNAACDEECNHLDCEYDLGQCFTYFDYHGYGWDFEGCFATGCTREMLFDQVCDEVCDSDICHSDNWHCFTHDEYELYDAMGNGWDDDLELCLEGGCTEGLLFNTKCDDVCDSEACHYDNWKCWAGEEARAAGGGDDPAVFKDDL
eukprot:SAG22_NODE_159_length_16948_cov_14.480503_5_plen_237_part_00